MAKFKIDSDRSQTMFNRLVFDVSPEVRQQAQEIADENGISLAEFVRQAVQYALDNME